MFGIRALLACAYGELPLPPILAVYRDQLIDHSARIADFRSSRRIGLGLGWHKLRNPSRQPFGDLVL